MTTKHASSGALERSNRWPGACEKCSTYVAAHAGVISLDKVSRRWRVFCTAHDPRRGRPVPTPKPVSDPAPSTQPEPEPDIFSEPDPEPVEPTPLEIIVTRQDAPSVTIAGPFHPSLPQIVTMLGAHCHVYLVGPAGSGKTTLARQAAEALALPFYFTGAVGSPFELTGFRDAHGNYQRTQWREAVENGGLFLFDEIDASDPRALLRFNAALANGVADFPDGAVTVHDNLRVIAAANTFGHGADRVYVGRNQLDAATLDRFATVAIDYDDNLERSLGDPAWTAYVHKVRHASRELKLRHVVSTRAVIAGTRLLTAGVPVAQVAEAVLWRGLEADSRAKIEYQVPLPAERIAA